MATSATASSRKVLVGTLVPLVLVLGVGGGVYWKRLHARSAVALNPPPPRPAAETRTTTPVEARPDFLGVILNGSTVDLAPKAEGKLLSVCCQVGDRVSRGQVVATLETRATSQDLMIAEAALRGAQAESHRASVDYAAASERLARRQRAAADALSAEELSNARYEKSSARARLSVAQAQVSQAKARVTQLQSQVTDAELRADSDSVVSARYADPGALIRPGSPVVRLISTDQMRVRFAVPQEDGGLLVIGAPVRIEIKATGTFVTGKLENVAPEVDASSRMIFALATVDRSPTLNNKLFGGMVVRITVGDPAPLRVPITDQGG